jgi:hypothetical protein
MIGAGLVTVLLLGLLVAGCGTTQQNQTSIALTISSLTVNAAAFKATLLNSGPDAAGPLQVKFTLDVIYDSAPESKTVAVSGLDAGSAVTVETTNDLTPSWGKGQHHVLVRVESGSQSLCSHEAYYYDGNYQAEYDCIFAQQVAWRTAIRDRFNSDYGSSLTKLFDLQLLDSVTYDGNSVAGLSEDRTINGETTPVIFLNLKMVHTGYSTYTYDGVRLPECSSEEVFYHEGTHACYERYVTDSSSRAHWNATPRWFNEGLATYTAGQGPGLFRERVWELKVFNGWEITSVEAWLLNGLDKTSEQHTYYDYAQDYLAIQTIVDKYGAAALKNIVHDIAFGADVKAAIIDNLALTDWASFESKVYSQGITTIRDCWPHIY